jgi:4-hydroxybenzoate polyprenyltransferase/phosphoserine phosphatase
MPSTGANTPANSIPLCVDLDGTLIKTDVLWESLVLLLKRNPFYLLVVPFWLLRGRAFLKSQIAMRTELKPASLPYHEEFMKFLRAEREQGRPLILASAADSRLAESVASHVGIFKEVVASNGQLNMRGRNKGHALAERFGKKGFDYAGNSTVDLPVWREARQAIVVNACDSLAQRARGCAEVSRVFPRTHSRLRALLTALRPHQWIKNVIVFVPVITSHRLGEASVLLEAILAFVAFCLCASGGYVLNDLVDLDADRHHATKKNRPFASGDLALSTGLIMAPLLLIAGVCLGWWLSWKLALALAFYLVLSTSYSVRLKQIALLDVFCLAALYTLRLIAGHEVTGIPYSSWLLAFSLFIFLSLALLKRFTELRALRLQKEHGAKGRGYVAADLELVAMLGVASGFLAVLVMALYVNSPEVWKLYLNPVWLLMVCPLLLFWISRIWLIAHRGGMHDDPVVFALRDGVSYVIGVLMFGVIVLATGHF